ncbi:MAG: hypothetical protein JNL21_10090 [Myxococcales bacterium]|nr:hypothetical protein [Myxococcales bacterium]
MSSTIVIILVSAIVPIALVVFIMGALMKGQKATNDLLQRGTPARGRILQLGTTGGSVAVMGHRHLKLILTVEVWPQMGQPYTATFEQLISELQLPSVQPGAQVELRVDPQNPSRIALASVGGAGAMGQQPMGQQPMGQPGPWGAQPQAPMGAPMPVAVMTPQYKSAVPMIAIIMFFTTVPTVGILLYVFWDFESMFGGSSSKSSSDDDESASDDEEKPKKKKGGVCSQAAACCKVIGQGTAASACDNFEKGMPVSGCRQALDGYKQAAKAMGKSCD